MADISFIPYGNAHEQPNGSSWSFTCQHGQDECYYNQILSCSNKYLTDPLVAFYYTNCVMIMDDPALKEIYYEVVVNSCFAQIGIQGTPESNSIDTCWNAEEGRQLEHDNAVLTDALNPTHTYVPWIVGQGVHNDEIQS